MVSSRRLMALCSLLVFCDCVLLGLCMDRARTPHTEPENTQPQHSSRMHSAINRLDDTTTIAPRSPSSLTTELEPRIQSPSNTQSQNTSKLHSAINRLDDTTSIAPRPSSSLTTELEPRYRARVTRNHNSAAECTFHARSSASSIENRAWRLTASDVIQVR